MRSASLQLFLYFAVLATLSFPIQVTGQPIDYDHANLSFFRNLDGSKQRIQNKADWEIRRKQVLAGMQRAMGNFPANRTDKFSVTEIAQSRLGDVDIKTLRLSVNAKSHVVADVYLPKSIAESKEKVPAILALHPTGTPGKRIIGGPAPRKNRQYANELAN
ncbi:MAG: hypothetical protein VX438_11875, partial [Planctomycetota bacterium]|nr:hypothetical protein [Planctomycetota bacterium]